MMVQFMKMDSSTCADEELKEKMKIEMRVSEIQLKAEMGSIDYLIGIKNMRIFTKSQGSNILED